MATIVCLKRETVRLGPYEYDKLDITDGQQRLTTIVLLLNTIKLALHRNKEESLSRDISELLVKSGSDTLLLLQTNFDTSHYFSDFLRDGVVPTEQGRTLADRELSTAIEDCQNFVTEWEERQNVVGLYACVINQLYFILHEVAQERLVYTVFEVLNSRGMEVPWLDRLKSILMGKAFELEGGAELIRELRTIWSDIYSQVGLRQDLSTEALRFAATLYRSSTLPSRPLSEKDAVDKFSCRADDVASIRKVAKWLLQVTKACYQVKSNTRWNAVTQIAQARLLAVAIHLRDDMNNPDQNLLSRWEKISFRIYGMFRKDARTKVGDYVRLAWRIVNDVNLSVEDIDTGIRSIGDEFPIETAVSELSRQENSYEGWQDELRYFMFRYEEHLSWKLTGNRLTNEQWNKIWEVSPSKSIEHIIPQSTAPDDIKHNLGNLMMLPPDENARLGNLPTEEKLDRYRQIGLYSAIEVAKQPQWTSRTVLERERRLLEWAQEEWAD